MICEIREHAIIYHEGSTYPYMFHILPGHRRGGIVKAGNGDIVFMMGASSVESEPTKDYKRKEGETVEYLFGFVINSPEEAETLGEWFVETAEKMRSGEIDRIFEKEGDE